MSVANGFWGKWKKDKKTLENKKNWGKESKGANYYCSTMSTTNGGFANEPILSKEKFIEKTKEKYK